ncbi:MAG: CvpA family protein [Elusimicrobia bacterium]|nr:CvpA family protein [Elusimicrobiota bacterium]
MACDLVIAALIAFFAIAGYRSGAVRQLAHIIGLAVALLGTKPAATAVGPALALRMGWDPARAENGLCFVLFPLILFAAGVAARVILNLLEPGDERGPLDQGLGFLVGGAKGGALLFVVLGSAFSFEKPLAQMQLDLDARTRGSCAAAFIRRHNLFADTKRPPTDALNKLLDGQAKPKARPR